MRLLPILGTALAQAFRALRRRPGTALVSVAILALGIGASVAVFSVVSAVLLAPLRYEEPARLALVEHRGSDAPAGLVPAEVAAVYARSPALAGVGYIRDVRDGILEVPDGAVPVRVGVATVSLFRVLGVRPAAGRLPSEAGGAAGAGDVALAGNAGGAADAGGAAGALVSHAFWRDRLDGRADAVGEAIVVDGVVLVVTGVLPADFRLALPPATGLPDRADVWVGLPVPLEDMRRVDGRLRDQDSDNRGVVVARLAPGVTPERAGAELSALRRRMEATRGDAAAGTMVAVVPLRDAATAAARPVLLALLAAVLLVLVLTAANVSALLLARAADRSTELAVRAALGAGRGELAVLVAGEGALVGAGAGVLGLLVAVWGRDLLLRFQPAALGMPDDAPFDAGILAFAAVATLLATVLAAAIPAFRAGAPAATASLRTDAASSATGGAARARRALVMAEIACALALLAGAGLLTRTASNLGAVDMGFDPGPVTTFELALIHPERYRGPGDRGRFVRTLVQRLEAEPAVAAAGVIGGLPLGGESFTQPWGHPGESPDEWRGEANFRVVDDAYFDAVGTPVVAGRAFRPEDDRQDVRVVVIDRALASRLGREPGAAPRAVIGDLLALPLDGRAEVARVVGVVESVRFHGLRAPPAPTVYVPYRHEASRRITVAVRSTTGRPLPRSFIDAAVTELDPDLAVFAFAPMRDHVRRTTSDTRFALGVFSAFAVLASLLAAIGVYAVLARWVGVRTAEIGIRMALGADRRRVTRLVLGETLLVLVPGLAAGLLLAAALATSARALLFRVTPLDPAVLLSVTALVTLAALAAAILPARRAARLSPSAALRS